MDYPLGGIVTGIGTGHSHIDVRVGGGAITITGSLVGGVLYAGQQAAVFRYPTVTKALLVLTVPEGGYSLLLSLAYISRADPTCLRLVLQAVSRVFALDQVDLGIIRATRILMTAITVINSAKEDPF